MLSRVINYQKLRHNIQHYSEGLKRVHIDNTLSNTKHFWIHLQQSRRMLNLINLSAAVAPYKTKSQTRLLSTKEWNSYKKIQCTLLPLFPLQMAKPVISWPSATEFRSDHEYERKGVFCAGGRGSEAAADNLLGWRWRGGSGQGGDIDVEMELFPSSPLSAL